MARMVPKPAGGSADRTDSSRPIRRISRPDIGTPSRAALVAPITRRPDPAAAPPPSGQRRSHPAMCWGRTTATWTPSPSNADNAQYEIYDDGTLVDTVTVNQQLAPNGTPGTLNSRTATF